MAAQVTGAAEGLRVPPLPPYSGRQYVPWIVCSASTPISAAAAGGGVGLGSGDGSDAPLLPNAFTSGSEANTTRASCSTGLHWAKGEPKFCSAQASKAGSPAWY